MAQHGVRCPRPEREHSSMDRTTFLGGSPLGVVIRLALISIAVGIVMSALGIDLRNFFDRLDTLLRHI
jgi:hypothetical protein